MKKEERKNTAKRVAADGVLMAVLIILGMIKLPSFFPGAEFQMSAPYAVCLAAAVGFRRYLTIGICSSIIQLLLGTHTIWNVAVAMVFRITAGIIVTAFPRSRAALAAAGPAGTAAARIVLAFILRVPLFPLLAAAVPGMIFTAVCAAAGGSVVYKTLKREELSL